MKYFAIGVWFLIKMIYGVVWWLAEVVWHFRVNVGPFAEFTYEWDLPFAYGSETYEKGWHWLFNRKPIKKARDGKMEWIH